MSHDISDNLLRETSAWIASRTGLHFPRKKWPMLKKAVQAGAAACRMDLPAFLEKILPPSSDNQLYKTLLTHLTIGETYFFRDKHLFQLLKDQILRDLLSQRLRENQPINILSAGCASGEEPYSVAILIDQAFPLIRKKTITIIGTDINPLFLEKAEKGIYSRWSLRETPDAILTDYFTPLQNGYFELSPHIREKVRFRRLNLMKPDYPAQLDVQEPFHIIFCRNVLMYFMESGRKDVVERLTRLLAEKGWLITGPAETGFVRSPQLKPTRFVNTLLHQKCPLSEIKAWENRHSSGMPLKLKLPETTLKRSSARAHPIDPDPIISASASDHQDEASDIRAYQEALELYEKGNYASSAALLEQMMEKIRMAGSTFLMAPDAMILLARAYANLGRIQEARRWCDNAVSSGKLNPEIHFLRAVILQSAGEIPAAVQSLKQALFLDPDFVMAHFMIGLLNKSPAGKKSLQNALSLLKDLDPDDALPFSEGMTAARLSETITGMIQKRGHA
jgi:chemotaxis protein methyltransferase CheR